MSSELPEQSTPSCGTSSPPPHTSAAEDPQKSASPTPGIHVDQQLETPGPGMPSSKGSPSPPKPTIIHPSSRTWQERHNIPRTAHQRQHQHHHHQVVAIHRPLGGGDPSSSKGSFDSVPESYSTATPQSHQPYYLTETSAVVVPVIEPAQQVQHQPWPAVSYPVSGPTHPQAVGQVIQPANPQYNYNQRNQHNQLTNAELACRSLGFSVTDLARISQLLFPAQLQTFITLLEHCRLAVLLGHKSMGTPHYNRFLKLLFPDKSQFHRCVEGFEFILDNTNYAQHLTLVSNTNEREYMTQLARVMTIPMFTMTPLSTFPRLGSPSSVSWPLDQGYYPHHQSGVTVDIPLQHQPRHPGGTMMNAPQFQYVPPQGAPAYGPTAHRQHHHLVTSSHHSMPTGPHYSHSAYPTTAPSYPLQSDHSNLPSSTRQVPLHPSSGGAYPAPATIQHQHNPAQLYAHSDQTIVRDLLFRVCNYMNQPDENTRGQLFVVRRTTRRGQQPRRGDDEIRVCMHGTRFDSACTDFVRGNCGRTLCKFRHVVKDEDLLHVTFDEM